MHRRLEPGQVAIIASMLGAAHAISAPPPNEKKDRKKLDAAKAIDRPKMIWISRRNPPAVSPNASVSPVTMMMITATIFATGPWTDSKTCWSRSEEHTSELQSLMRISYAVFCLINKNKTPEIQSYSYLGQ